MDFVTRPSPRIAFGPGMLEKLPEFIKENGIEFPLVSDSEKEFRKNYGRGRLTYLIDKQGIIKFIQKGVPSNADFLEQLKMLP